MNNKINKLVIDYVKNYQQLSSTETGWLTPVVGVSKADNPLFIKLKEIIGPSHALPTDFIKDAKSVIVFFLPFQDSTVSSNIGGIESSREWDIANIETNSLIIDLSKHLSETISTMGYTSTVLPPTYNYNEKELLSDWSHRHIGYIAGIGTFGIHNMLITESGCCGRLGSVITNLPLLPTERKSRESCLFKHNGTCRKCTDRCVVTAISIDNGYPFVNKRKCNSQIYDNPIPQYSIGLGDACGKCMCGVPCSLQNPNK